MDLKEFLASGKRGKLKNSNRINEFGLVEETEDGDFVHVSEAKGPVKLKHTEILMGEWELERLPRTFYLGITKIQTHLHLREILQAVERPDGTPPEGKPSDNQAWIKVVEVLD